MNSKMIFFLFILFNQLDAFSEVEKCETLKLDREVYSSSYLQKNLGPMSSMKSGVDYYSPLESPPNVYFPEKVIVNRFSRNLMERFSQARNQVLNKKDDLVENSFINLHVPQAPPWEGFCHQWSTAALDPQVAKLIKGNQDIICGDILFSAGEVRELFTATVNGEWLEKLHGKKRETPLSLRGANHLSSLGVDDFDAFEFHKAVKENLKNKKGFVFDVDPGPEVWNQPAISSTICESEVEIAKLSFEEFKFIPLELLESKDEKNGVILGELRQNEFLYLFKARFDDPSSELSDEELERLDKELGRNGKTFFENRQEGQRILYQQFKEGKIQLGSQIRIKKIKNRVTYALEGSFSSNHQPKETKTYDYLIFENPKGEVMNSKWVTPAEARPDFLWVPSHENSETELSSDLKQLIKFCKKGAEFTLNKRETEIAQQLYVSGLNNSISDEEALRINNLFENLSKEEKKKIKMLAKRYIDLPGTSKILPLFK